ncbi:PAS domain S-box protein [Chromatium okenii]|uniref:PAC domain-containing protein n=1 Tax=Chromatium okenii TaxID=61644 RepID=A0A2S7XMZ3_9GAMM|nr:PAS domain S-box protein [Chromatium okenii]PQJ95026.1 hypothetical protein CXB77_11830 [Chromatium okenii]
MIHPDDRLKLQHFLRNWHRENAPIIRSIGVICANGEVVWGDVRVTMIPGLDGDSAAVSMVEDITERLAAQEHNQRLQHDLDAARERATLDILPAEFPMISIICWA